MIAGIVKAALIGFLGWSINMALGQKLVAKAIVVLIVLLCVNIVVKGCEPYINKTEKRIEKVEKFMDKVYGIEEKTDQKLDKTEQKIRNFLFEPPKIR